MKHDSVLLFVLSVKLPDLLGVAESAATTDSLSGMISMFAASPAADMGLLARFLPH